MRVVLPLVGARETVDGTWGIRLQEFHAACNQLGCEPVVLKDGVDEYGAQNKTHILHDKILPYVEWADVVMTHWFADVHQSHAAIAKAVELTSRPFRRPKPVLMFEVPSSTDQGFINRFQHNCMIQLDPLDLSKKEQAMAQYQGQFARGRTPEDLRIHSRYRGSLAGAYAAECFFIGRSFY